MENIKETVTAILARFLAVKPEDITPESNLREDLGADSLDIVELVMEFEKEFDISIDDKAAENLETVDQIITCIEQMIENK